MMMKVALIGKHFRQLDRALLVQQDDFVPEDGIDHDKELEL